MPRWIVAECVTMPLLAVVLAGLLTIAGCISSTDASAAGGEGAAVDYIEKTIEWVRSQGGFVHEALKFQPIFEEGADRTANPSGVFAAADFKKGDALITIPRSCLIVGSDGGECSVIPEIVRERRLGDASRYAPYVSYLYDGNAMAPLPSQYSAEAKTILDKLIGSELPTSKTMTRMSLANCGDDYLEAEEDRELSEQAFYFVLQRSWDNVMVPIYDLINHRSGRWLNVDSTSTKDPRKGVTVFALRDIKAGEQLHNAYNNCTDSQYPTTYVAQHIMRDFGFVEQYPQRWQFQPLERFHMVFDVDEREPEAEAEAAEDKRLFVTWVHSIIGAIEDGGPPDDWSDFTRDVAVRYFSAHLQRLEGLKNFVTDGVSHLESSHERETITEFYEALVTAMQLAMWSVQDASSAIKSEACNSTPGGDKTSEGCPYDELEERDPADFRQINGLLCLYDYEFNMHPNYTLMEEIESEYQEHSYERMFSEDGTSVDTCLRIAGGQHSCSSYRAHYHELLIHYPAQYLDQSPKRILYMGGGMCARGY